MLSGILLQARDGRLEMYSTDMELSIKASIATTVETEGEAVVPARLFTDVIKNMAASEVRVEAGDGVVKILAGKATFSLNSWVASDFPPTSSFDMSDAFALGIAPFVETLDKVGRAASRDETRPILTGVLVTIGAGKLKMVATDSYRLSVKETPLEGGPADEIQAIVPVKALSEVQRLGAGLDDGELRLLITENQALFAVERRVDRDAADRRSVPRTTANFCPTASTTPSSSTARAARGHTARQPPGAEERPLRLQFSEGKLTIRAVTQDVGQAEEELDAPFSGEPFEIGFNPLFLIDGLEGVAGDTRP